MQSDERQIRDLVETWMTATRAGDLESVLGLMADDVVFLTVGNPPMIGKDAFAAAAAGMACGNAPQFDGHSEIQEIQIHGDRAFLWTRLKVIVTPPGGGANITRAGHTLTILKKQNGRWVLARDANLLVRVDNEQSLL
jgi:uncharacterized protein (TIGR02246 family)